MSPAAPLFASVRAHGAALLESVDDPAAELLAMVWGSRFDREHARTLLDQQAQATRHPDQLHTMVQTVMQAADTFDRLPAQRQQRLRQLIRLQIVRADGGATIAA